MNNTLNNYEVLKSNFNEALDVISEVINDSRIHLDSLYSDIVKIAFDEVLYIDEESMKETVNIINHYNEGLLTDSEAIDKIDESTLLIDEINKIESWTILDINTAFEYYILENDYISKETLYNDYNGQDKYEILFDFFLYDSVLIDEEKDLFIFYD